jgi:hypothetical protein
MKFENLPKQQRTNIANRVKQLRGNLVEYQYQVANLKNRLVEAEYQVYKTSKELNKMLDSFEDSVKI